MSNTSYMKIKCKDAPRGVSINKTGDNHHEWIPILKWNFGGFANVDAQTASAEGNIVMSRPLVVSCRSSEATPLLYAIHWNNTPMEVEVHIMDNGYPEAGAQGYRKDSQEKIVWKIFLESSHITSIATRSTAESVLTDHLELFARYVRIEYQGKGVTKDAKVSYDWEAKEGA